MARSPGPNLPSWLAGLPHGSLVLVVLWLAVTFVVELGHGGERRLAGEQLRDAVRYAIEHPVVAVHPRILPLAQAAMPGFQSNEMFSFLRKGRAEAARRQHEFDAKAAAGLARLDAHPTRRLGLVAAAPRAAGVATHWLVHAGWAHALGLALLLLLAGPTLERLWGRRVFLPVLAGCSAAGAAVFVLVHGGSDRALLGGGAAVAGAVGALVARLRSDEVDLLAWVPADGAELVVPAWGVAPLWLLAELLLGFWAVPGSLPGGVDHAAGWSAHAAGLAVGACAALALQRAGWEERFGEPPADASVGRRTQRFDFQRVLDARGRGESDLAWELLSAEAARSCRNRQVVTTFWEMAIERGEPDAAAPALAGLVAEELRRGAEELAVAQWRELAQHVPGTPPDPETLVCLIPAIRRLDGDEHAVIAVQQLLDPRAPAPDAPTALRAAALTEPFEQGLAVKLARRGLEARPLPAGLRVELEAVVARYVAPASEGGPAEAERKPLEDELADSFFAESDRSEFGSADDLGALEDFPRGVVSVMRPVALGDAALRLSDESGESHEIAYDRVRALSLAGVHGLGPKPVIVIDLLIDGGGSGLPLRVVRLRSDGFPPQRLFPEIRGGLAALRELARTLLERSRGRALPDPQGALANPVRVFPTLGEYEARVLRPLGAVLA